MIRPPLSKLIKILANPRALYRFKKIFISQQKNPIKFANTNLWMTDIYVLNPEAYYSITNRDVIRVGITVTNLGNRMQFKGEEGRDVRLSLDPLILEAIYKARYDE
jgi:hypothetical protein